MAWKTIRQLRWQKIYFVTRALTRVSLLNSWDGTKCGEKKLKIPLAKQLSYRYLDILVYNCRIGHSSTITTEVNHYTISNYVYKIHLNLFWKWWMNDLMLFACIYLWKADFFWGWQKQIGTALKPIRSKFGIKRFPSFASWYYKVSTIQFWRENIRDKWCRLLITQYLQSHALS